MKAAFCFFPVGVKAVYGLLSSKSNLLATSIVLLRWRDFVSTSVFPGPLGIGVLILTSVSEDFLLPLALHELTERGGLDLSELRIERCGEPTCPFPLMNPAASKCTVNITDSKSDGL